MPYPPDMTMNGFASTLVLLTMALVGCLANACGEGPDEEPRADSTAGGAPPSAGRDGEEDAAPPGGGRPSGDGEGRAPPPERDDGWVERRPHLSFLLVANQRGTFKPCGCSEPQLGGLERLATLLEITRRRAGEGFSAVSLGWTLADRGEAQESTKASLYRAALETMGFDALLLGGTDLHTAALAQPFVEGTAYDAPTPPANVPLAKDGPLGVAAGTEPFAKWEVRGQPVRALTIVDPDAFQQLNDVAPVVLPPAGALQLLERRADTLWIAGTDVTGAAMDGLVAAMRRLGPAVIVDLTGVVGVDRLENVPFDRPFVVTLGELGKEVGVLDLDRAPTGEGWMVSYHAVRLDPELERVPSALRDRVSALFDVYRREVRAREYLLRFETLPNDEDIAYVGSARCARCHPGIYEEWLDTPHAGALRTLKAKDYHWDPECVRCHVVGFERFPDGRWARVRGGFIQPKKTPHLGGVGCECCHGPGEAHVESPRDRSLFAEGGPNRRHPGRRGCAVCHDVENSFGFQESYEKGYLPHVDHSDVPSDRRNVYEGE